MSRETVTAEETLASIRRQLAVFDGSKPDHESQDSDNHSAQTVTEPRLSDKGSIGARLRLARGDRSQRELSGLLGVSPITLIRYERDERSPDAEMIVAVCRATGVTSEWLLFGVGDGPTKAGA